jgi:hypothetical protein
MYDNVVVHIVSYSLHASFVVNNHTFMYEESMKVCLSCPPSEDHYNLREIMLRRTKGVNIRNKHLGYPNTNLGALVFAPNIFGNYFA